MQLRDRAKRLSNTLFKAGDRLGVHLLPAHYYSSLPSWKWLRTNEQRWRQPSSMAGIHWDLDEQARWLRDVVADHPAELDLRELRADAEKVGGLRYGEIEAQTLYGVIRSRQPKRLVEVGSGSSTLVMSKAVQRNVSEGGPASEILAIDPFTAHRVVGLPHVRSAAVHGIDLTLADLALEPGDVLFIDSTHAVRTGSEVPHLYLNLVPKLPAGVLLHIHDIYLPFLYPPTLYETYFDWQESVLVAALLVENRALAVRAGMVGLFHDRPEVLHELFPDFRPARIDRGIGDSTYGGHYPSALWLETAPTG